MKKKTKDLVHVPVICIGNFVIGGVGKTPFALALAKSFMTWGRKPVFLSRGYKGCFAGPIEVNLQCHRAWEVGDEAMLLAACAPTVVARDRLKGAQLAQTLGNLIIMDDGFQNSSISKTFSLVLIDSETGIGNGLCIPAGPLRAPVDRQLKFADGIGVVGLGDRSQEICYKASQIGLPIFSASLRPIFIPSCTTKKVLAFCAIGQPKKFLQTLEALGFLVKKTKFFPDHHRFTSSDAKALLQSADHEKLLLVTTEKDKVRLMGEKSIYLKDLAKRTQVIHVIMEIHDKENLLGFIEKKIISS